MTIAERTVTCKICGGPQSITGTATVCPNPECDWHECDTPPIWLNDEHTCPDCGERW